MSRRREHVHVDHLAVLVNGPVDVAPQAGNLDVSLVDEPAIPGSMTDGRAASINKA